MKFEKLVKELIDFEGKYGHHGVPLSGKTKKLGVWHICLRKSCRIFEEGVSLKDIHIDEERLRLLEYIGFDC